MHLLENCVLFMQYMNVSYMFFFKIASSLDELRIFHAG